MLKRPITYTDFDDNEVTEIFYFHLSKPELIEMDIEHDQGLEKFLKRIIETKDHKELLKQFKDLVLMAYGEKSEDGKHFIKSEESKKKFSQSAAYQALYMELATDDKAAADFLKGAMPKDLGAAVDQDKPTQLPQPPAPVPPKPPTT